VKRKILRVMFSVFVMSLLNNVPSIYAAVYQVIDLGVGQYATAINDQGTVVGYTYSGLFSPLLSGSAYIQQGGTTTDIPPLTGYTDSRSLAVNNQNQVVGFSGNGTVFAPFVWDKGVLTNLGNLGGGWNFATGINDIGRVVGYSSFEGYEAPVHAFLWYAGTMIDLGTMSGFVDSYAHSINNSGQVVGSIGDRMGIHAALWENGIMKDLNDLADLDGAMTLLSALSINESGQIIALAIEEGGGDHVIGPQHAVLLNPVPILGAVWPFGSGLIGLVSLRRRLQSHN